MYQIQQVILVTIVDQAAFNEVKAKRVFNTVTAAHKWGEFEVDARTARDIEAGEDIIHYAYETETLEYQVTL